MLKIKLYYGGGRVQRAHLASSLYAIAAAIFAKNLFSLY